MAYKKFKSFAKINLFLNVGKKIKKLELHDIESLVCIIDLFDEIKLKKNKNNRDQIKFIGKFNGHINKKNTISNSLKILREEGVIKKENKYDILVNKKIPVFSGLGGGSSNAAYLIKNFFKKNRISQKRQASFVNHIGSDLKLFFGSNQIYQKKLNKITKLKTKLKLYFIIVYPFFKSSTKEIYSKIRFTKKLKNNSLYEKGPKNKIIQGLLKERNSLEKIVVSKFPKVKKILLELKLLNECQFSRVTGSGSACFGVFLSKKRAVSGLKKIKKKFPKYWCVVGKTI